MEIVKMEVREAGDGAAAGECVRVPPKKYTWAEVRQAVHDLRKELSSLSTMVPMAISFRKLANGKTRVYFLRTPQNGWEITLLYTDVTPSVQPNNTRLEWKPLIESNVALGVTSGKWSREEQLLWERQRVAAWGIASYELHEPTGRVLFPCASSLFVAEESQSQSPPLIPRSLETGGGAALTPAMCPRSPSLVAHAARGDVWLAGGGLRRPTRLTYACRGREPERLADDPRQAGVPCYVTQEEFSRYTGFWWQPTADDDVFRIVYEEVDESEVKIFSFPSSQASSGDVEEFRFPRAGTPNAKSILRLVTFRLRPAAHAHAHEAHTAHAPTVLDCYHDHAHMSTSMDEGSNSASVEVYDVRWLDLRRPLKESFPWFEYLARVGWTPCGQYVWVQLLDRKQQRLELALIPLAAFNAPFAYDLAPPATATAGRSAQQGDELLDRKQQRLELVLIPLAAFSEPFAYDLAPPATATAGRSAQQGDEPIQVLVSEHAPDAWINVHDILHFLGGPGDREGGPEDRISFVWGSERSGYMHLYRVTCQLQRRQPASVAELLQADLSDAVGPLVVEEEALTAGEWEVMPRKIWVDEARALVYFVGLRETPLERHLYVAPLRPAQAPDPVLLTTPGHSANVDIDTDCSLAVITVSSINSAPETRVYRITHSPAALIPQGALHTTHTQREGSESRFNGSWDGGDDDCSDTTLLIRERTLSAARAQLFRTKLSCGLAAYCTLWRGNCAAPRAPTVLHVYGGPEVQTVTNSYKGIRQLRMHMLAARGFNVVAIDSRGSKHRGRAWEGAIRGRLGQLELDDQVEVLQWLAKETGCIDMERVAIHGWSYGGYLSLLGLATRPTVFKVCVAGAPVTCWRLYDTAYTERYMGPPARAPHAYTRASVLAHAPFFPDQEGRLLIIHGLADENVHFCHTAALLAELVRLGKPHRVQVYPGERHSLRAMHAAKHYETTLLHFLHENL